jgi:galactofuranosylgalactofuranosylrhamnosyl-N-acetylglucosaminyl-diphospho-decaprenol beta-1,5/1,6-galactofuranosyltransferase
MTNIPPLTVIQRLVPPTTSGLGLPEKLYHAARHRVVFRPEDGAMELLPGGEIDLFSYFNAFSLTHWRQAVDHASVGLRIGFAGELTLTVELHRSQSGKSVVLERQLESAAGEICLLENIFADLGAVKANEIASVVISSERGGIVRSCDWFTTQQPRVAGKVGIVITHFNRQQWVLPAVDRFKRELLSDPDFAGRCELVVVDNSRNLELEAAPGLVRVPSHNYGCSGGFAKGLSYLAESEEFTHAVFMDDDATCEIESIKRIINFYQFSENPQLAISGALFCEPNFDRIYEAGASWGSTWQPKFAGLKLLGRNLLELTRGNRGATYGGWWCFGFPLHSETRWPFPFFVRGDDVTFSLSNAFQITSPLGVACWAESFDGKDSAALKYVDARMHTMPPLVFGTCGLGALLGILSKICFSCLESYRYAAAEIFLHGVEDSLGSEDYWLENADGRAYRARYAGLFAEESYGHLPPGGGRVLWRDNFKEDLVRKAVRYATLGGHLLPRFLLPSRRLLTLKSWSVPNHNIFPYYRVRIHDSLSGKSWDTERDIPRLLRILWRMLVVDVQVARAYLFHRDKYRRIYDSLSTRESWEKIFSTTVAEKETPSS